jgi:ribosome biogenesis GTPase / thiamine phosphate phosphatase
VRRHAFNKAELGVPPVALAELAGYAALDVGIVQCSARAAPGIESLAAQLKGAVSVLVGQSGTGKSSLLNALAPEARAVTQEISAATEQGRHTTTHAVLHRLASGGDLIDSPGVRDYAPPVPAARDVASGFVEIQRAAAGCRFQDCLHDLEPGCAVRAAVAGGAIRARRYESFRRLLALGREMGERFPDRGPGRGSGAR